LGNFRRKFIYIFPEILGQILRYFGRYPAMGSARYRWGAWRTLAGRNVDWRLWNKFGPRQCV